MEIKIGVLLPRSDMFPKLAVDFLNGFKLSFSGSDAQGYIPKLIIESVGNATDRSLLQTVEKMMLQEETDIIIGFCSYFMLEELVTIANSYKKPFIHVSLGARVLKANHYSPYVLHHSLNLCHSGYLSGKYAAASIGKKAAMLVSFYDGGYHMAEAFAKGFTDQGGEIVYSYVSPMDYKSEIFDTMVAGITDAEPDVLFTLFSYKEGNKIFDVLSQSGLNRIPGVAIPLMTDESTLAGNFEPANVYSIASWAFEEDIHSMKDFCLQYKSQFSEPANIISLLGVEMGEILIHCLQNEEAIPKQIGDYLKTQTIVTPRGALRFTDLNESVPATFKVRQLKTHENSYQNTVIEVLDSSLSEKFYTEMENLPYTGWKNPYICT